MHRFAKDVVGVWYSEYVICMFLCCSTEQWQQQSVAADLVQLDHPWRCFICWLHKYRIQIRDSIYLRSLELHEKLIFGFLCVVLL